MFDYRHLKLAMAVQSKNPHWKLTEVRARHWLAVAKAAGLGGNTSITHDIAAQIPNAVAAVNAQIPSNFPSALVDKFFVGLHRQASLLGDLS
jgi:serine/threonine-protein kinase HipA